MQRLHSSLHCGERLPRLPLRVRASQPATCAVSGPPGPAQPRTFKAQKKTLAVERREVYRAIMIKSFKDRDTESLYNRRICFRWDDAPYEVEIVDYH